MEQKGFTLIEILVAVSILIIGIVGLYLALPRIFESFYFSKDYFIASYLGQEGMELVRNIRDGNWLRNDTWNNGLSDDDYQIAYNDSSLFLYQDTFLYLKDGFYCYNLEGVQTKFKRKITITNLADNKLNVKVVISWPEKAVIKNYEVQENLYDWK